MASVELKGIGKTFLSKTGPTVHALRDLNLRVNEGEFLTLVGPSGCGKTTMLRLIAGLETATSGIISIQGADMDSILPQDRDVAMVFQRDALYPHMTVFENLAFGLRLRKIVGTDLQERVHETAALLGIAHLLERVPETLSGGQRQRAALGRALARRPRILLLDEPLAHLDAPARGEMRAELLRVHRRLNTTILYVTHDQSEALALGQRVVVLHQGMIQQVADPVSMYRRPANMFVARFFGSPPMNLFHGTITQSGDQWIFREADPSSGRTGHGLELVLDAERNHELVRAGTRRVVLGLRPEHILCGKTNGPNTLNFCIEVAEHHGAETLMHFNTGSHRFTVRAPANEQSVVGKPVPLHFEITNASFFDPDSQNSLSTSYNVTGSLT